MRVVEPHHFQKLPKAKKPKSLFVPGLILIVVALGGLWLVFKPTAKAPIHNNAPQSNNHSSNATTSTPKALKNFTGEEFKTLYRSVLPTYPNTQEFSEPPSITGNNEADKRIRAMAEARGYQLTRIPIQAIVKIDEPRLDNDNLLQPLAAQGWQAIKAAARQAGYPLTLISAYRSPEYQRNLFMQRLLAHGVSVSQLAAGQADAAIEDNLHLTAVPGYSRHHTGYTVDMWCDDGSTSFLASRCYQWVTANNYQHAKEYGWIPSYPEGTKEQGPEPEPWEYVWVGRDRLEQ